MPNEESVLWNWTADPTKNQKFYVILGKDRRSIIAASARTAAIDVLAKKLLDKLKEGKSSAEMSLPSQIVVSTCGDMGPKTVKSDFDKGVYSRVYAKLDDLERDWSQGHESDIVFDVSTLYDDVTKKVKEGISEVEDSSDESDEDGISFDGMRK